MCWRIDLDFEFKFLIKNYQNFPVKANLLLHYPAFFLVVNIVTLINSICKITNILSAVAHKVKLAYIELI